jgi:hypothetical protein
VGVWSGPVIRKLVGSPDLDLEDALEEIGDPELASAVREASLEPVPVSAEAALSSMSRLYEQHLDGEEAALREELRQYPTGPAPEALLRRRIEIVTEKTRLRAITAGPNRA